MNRILIDLDLDQDHNSSSSSEDSNSSMMLVPKRKMSKIMKIGAIICFITIASVIITAFATGKRVVEIINLDSPPAFEIGHISFNEKSKTFVFKDKKVGMPYLTIEVPHAVTSEKIEHKHFSNPACHIDIEEGFSYMEEQKLDTTTDFSDTVTLQNVKSERCMQFKNGISLAAYERSVDDMPCHYIQWTSSQEKDIVNCISMESENWYGFGSLTQHRWPLNRVNVPMQPFVTRSFVPNNKTIRDDTTAQFDSFLEPYLICANGAAITFDNTLPLFLSINSTQKEICFKAKYQKSKTREHPVILKYRVCKRKTAKYVHQDLLKSGSVLFSQKAPDSDLLQRPLWSTRGRNIEKISLEQVLHFVRNIKYNKLLYSQLQIDGRYSRASGNFYFNAKTFSRSHQFIMELDSEGNGDKFKVAIEVFPHVPLEMYAQYAVQYNQANNNSSQKPAILDVTNKDAIVWYKSKLNDIMRELSIAGFRFSGGQSSNFCQDLEDENQKVKAPFLSLNQFSTVYANISSAFGSRSLIGSGFRSQQHTFIADIGPMMSSWDHRKGLKSIIPTILTLGLMGYPFVLAGPIGGVSMRNVNMTSGQFPPPARELFIRWLQLTSFLPVMEFSTGPWEYDQAVTNHTRTLLEHRKDVLWPMHFSAAVEEATKIGTPIIRPLWWIAPFDKLAQFIDCEFILGKNLLVAPVLYENTRSRDIYLPQGSWWQDQLKGKSYKGGQWLGRYKVGLFEIATFKLIPRPK